MGRVIRLLIALLGAPLVVGMAFVAPGTPGRGTPQTASLGAAPDALSGAAGDTAGRSSSSGRQSRIARPHQTPPLRDLKPSRPTWLGNSQLEHETGDQGDALRTPGLRSAADDAALQTSASPLATPGPDQNFDGVNNVNGVLPPDTNGDVGPSHYMQWVNLSYAIYSKTGNLLVGPANGNTLFPGHPVCGTTNNGDPIVLYDSYAGRWLASQFAFQNISTGPYYQCIAISNSSDPTAGWCTYEFQVHSTKLNDYPKFAVWPSQNAYFLTAPQFTNGASFSGIGIWGFERDRMIACQPARMVYQDMQAIDSTLPRMLPADADGPQMPPSNAPEPILTMNWDGSGLPADQLQVWNATINWNVPSISVVKEGDVAAAAYDSNLCNYVRNCIPQPGTVVRIDPLANRLLHRVQYRNFGSHETLVASHNVDVNGADLAAVR
jgi:hypothetical protein